MSRRRVWYARDTTNHYHETTTTMNRNNAQLTDARVARHSNTDEDYREITRYIGKSFKPYARAANRKGRRAARRLLRNLEA